ncbi:MAG: hypothetical protein HC911_10505 [Chloroflexaceae bacterium]|nr:hypothetical protein [Chloroflexaceae bacterium]
MPKPKQFIAAPLDAYAERITTGVAYFGGILLLPLLFAYLSNNRWGGLLIPTAVALLIALFLLLTYLSQPTRYSIEGEQLVIRQRWFMPLRIPLKQISGVSFVPQLAQIPQHGIRFGFNPGVHGYQGPFYLTDFGRVFMLATNRERLVALARYPAEPLIISPANPRDFVLAMQAEVGSEGERR